MAITQDHIKRMAEEILRQQKYIEALETEVTFYVCRRNKHLREN